MTTYTKQITDGIAWKAVGSPDRPTVVFLHSLGADTRMWAPQVEALAMSHHMILVDIRGHGRSASPPGPYSLSELTDDVVRVADAAGVERFHVCGLSLGGMIGLTLAIDHPDRVLSVIACDTAARIGDRDLWEQRMEVAEAGGMETLRPTVIPRLFASDFGDRRPDWLAEANRVFSEIDPVGYVGCCAALRDGDLSGRLGDIRCRTLLIGGRLDVATPPEDLEWLAEHIAGSRVLVIEGAGHLSNMDRPEEFNRALTGFLPG